MINSNEIKEYTSRCSKTFGYNMQEYSYNAECFGNFYIIINTDFGCSICIINDKLQMSCSITNGSRNIKINGNWIYLDTLLKNEIGITLSLFRNVKEQVDIEKYILDVFKTTKEYRTTLHKYSDSAYFKRMLK